LFSPWEREKTCESRGKTEIGGIREPLPCKGKRDPPEITRRRGKGLKEWTGKNSISLNPKGGAP